jgi:aromatic ring hydroxylase
MRTSKQYREGLRKMRRNVYVAGEVVDRDDERMMGAVRTLSTTFDLAEKPEHEGLMTATSHLTGEKINRFCHVHQSVEDLHKKQDMTRFSCQQTGGCIQRCMGIDGTNAMSVISYEADQKYGTEYHKNLLKWLERFQKEDLVGCCAQTDVKGDRTKRPHQQADPDLYLHVVEKRSDGIVVRGAKAHNSEAAQADEIVVLPTRMLTPEEGEWAVAFAIPGDWENVHLVVRPASPRPRKHLDSPGSKLGMTDSLTIFDNAFIPWERVFLCGEHEFGGQLALLFALYHRHSYSGCKPAINELLLGQVALAAEYNGIAGAHHVRDKLSDIIMVAELGYAAGFTASSKGIRSRSGTYIPDVVYCNVGRCLSGENVYHELQTLADVAGGLPATLPYEEDFYNETVGPLLNKYIMRNPKISAENQHRLFRHISDTLCSSYGGAAAVGGLHGGGSPIMEKIAITAQYDIEARKKMVKRLAGIED